MKYYYYFALSMMMLGTQLLSAQCPPAQAIGILDANNISASVLTAGNLFTTGPEGHFKYLPAPGTPSTIFSTGFWVGGVKPNGELAISVSNYRSSNDNWMVFQPGPLDDFTNEPFDCSNWDRVFEVTKAEIERFLQDRLVLSEQQLIEQYPGVMGWPSVGNAHFEQVHNFPMPNRIRSLAPFLDYTQDGHYNPLLGDVPGLEIEPMYRWIMPDELIWCIMNDKPETNPSPLGIELHLTAWAFNCDENPVLKDVVFTKHQISYPLLDTTIIKNAYMGLFTDVDLGCYLDDFAGSHPASNTLFAYNQDAIDGDLGSNCNGVASFGEATPVQSMTFLNRSLSKSAAWSSGSSPADPNPNIPLHLYNLMSGVWPDGVPFTQGGVGYNPGSTEVVDHLFSGDPADPNAWSMCTSPITFPDTRLLGTIFLDTLEAGEQVRLYTAWMVTPDVEAPCSIGNTLERVAEVQALFDQGFVGPCGALVDVGSSPEEAEAFSIAPNPASDRFTIDLSSRGELRMLAADGRPVWRGFFEAGKHDIATRALPAGWYVVQYIQDGQVFTSRVVISR